MQDYDSEEKVSSWLSKGANRRSLLQGLAGAGLATAAGEFLSGKAVLASPSHLTSLQAINARSFGFLPSATATDNKKALAAALAAAKAAGVGLFVPAGLYLTEVGPVGVGALAVDFDATISGEGKGLTRIKIGPAVTAASEFILVRAGSTLTLENLCLEGPNAVAGVIGGNGTDAPDCFGIRHEGNKVGGAAGVILRNVAMSKWVNAVRMDHHLDESVRTGGRMKAFDSDFRARKTPVEVYGGNNNEAEIAAWACSFGLDEDEHFIGTQLEFCALRTHRTVAFELIDCHFTSSNKYGHLGDDGLTYLPVAKKAILINPTFDREVLGASGLVGSGSGINAGTQIVTTAKQLLILGGTFHSTIGVSAGCNTAIIGAKFLGYKGAGAAVDNNDGYLGALLVQACTVAQGDAKGFLYGIRREAAPSGRWNKDEGGNEQWVIKDNTFYGVDPVGAAILVDEGRVVIEGNTFYVDQGVASIYLKAGNCDVLRNRFYHKGRIGGSAGMIVQAINGNIDLTYQDNECRESGTYPQLLSHGTHQLTVHGSGNRLDNDEGFFIDSATNISGDMRPRAGVRPATYKESELTITWGADTFEVDFAQTELDIPTIQTIQLRGPLAGVVNNTIADGTVIYLRALAKFTLGDKGNILAKFTLSDKGNIPAPDTPRTVNSIITLKYFATSGKWIEC